ncbi:MAG: lytic transglycosylase domain-containing protein [Proteobacteria bacterium]|nr:lytic transglycosylase domain-containing protein [Pseudomonadota bacterium]
MGCRRGGRIGLPLWIAAFLVAATLSARAASPAGGLSVGGGGLCGDAIVAAQARYAVPHGLLYAIGQVESGRPDPVTHRVAPWPWTVQAADQSYYFASKAAAVAWVRAAQARGVVSIDIGCMQVNLHYHPTAFQNLDDAFDPAHNADYAARFLISLHAVTADWQKAAGLYHSQTLALAVPYAQKVEAALNGKLPGSFGAPAPKPTLLSMLQAAWGSTLDSQQGASPAPSAEGAATFQPVSAHHLRFRTIHPLDRQRPVLLSYER